MVCQGLQSCLEPGFLEPRAIIDKLANVSQSNIPIWSSQKPNLESQEHKEESKNDGDLLCWSFIQQSVLNNTQNVKEEATEEVYVHPLAKLSSSTLSTQSLEMCTEGLGSETGSNNVDDEIMADLSSLSCEIQTSTTSSSSRRGRIQRSREYLASFPPPLTLISGTDGIQLRPHREGGRLVLKAVAFSHKSCFRAERTDCRLRLFSLSKDDNTNDSRSVEYTDDYVCDDDTEEEEEGDEEEEEEEECKRGSCGKKLECEIESEEFPRPSSRCKEEGPRNNRGLNWEPVWVAIS